MSWVPGGFAFSETMRGTYALATTPHDRRTFVFTADLRAPSLLAHLRTGRMTLRGTLQMDGVADAVPIEGQMTLRPLSRRLIRYEFTFRGNDGDAYRFAGQKDIQFTKLRSTFTTLPGTVRAADGRLIATVTAYFDPRTDLRPFLASWRML